MGRCNNCRTQTQHFCFVHQEFVCDICLVNLTPATHAKCIVKTYRHWLQDGSYQWPPVCAACNNSLDSSNDIVRRACLHVEHATCLQRSAPPHHPCPSCNAPLEESLDDSVIGSVLSQRIQKMPVLKQLIPSPKASPKTHTTISTSDPILLKSSKVPTVPKSEPILAARPTSTKSATATTPHRQSQPKRPIYPAQKVSSEDSSTSAHKFQAPEETCIDFGSLKNKPADVTNVRNAAARKEKKTTFVNSNDSMRRAFKAGSRRWVDIRRKVLENKKQVAIAILFVASIFLIWTLTTGDEEITPITNRNSDATTDKITLPHVRVNPALLSPSGK